MGDGGALPLHLREGLRPIHPLWERISRIDRDFRLMEVSFFASHLALCEP